MVAKCSNPACDCLFRELSKGRVFLLPPTPDSSYWTWSAGNLSDYCYWLCPECDATLTITRWESGVVVRPREPSLLKSTAVALRRNSKGEPRSLSRVSLPA
jgi:hypothetical protein